MKRKFILIISGSIAACICVAVLFIGLFTDIDLRDYIPGSWDAHSGERPTDYLPSKWVSYDPDIWFEVMTQDDQDHRTGTGKMVLGDQIIDIEICFDMGVYMWIFDLGVEEDRRLAAGRCKFGADQFVVTITDIYNTDIWSDDCKQITFIREE